MARASEYSMRQQSRDILIHGSRCLRLVPVGGVGMLVMGQIKLIAFACTCMA
ncbi:hypothetical protein UNDYM_3984 [Undibacterium sp. YM2]|nr:hypothetical protein UNDYM_3984 [Undibacterium sp. YM2]